MAGAALLPLTGCSGSETVGGHCLTPGVCAKAPVPQTVASTTSSTSISDHCEDEQAQLTLDQSSVCLPTSSPIADPLRAQSTSMTQVPNDHGFAELRRFAVA